MPLIGDLRNVSLLRLMDLLAIGRKCGLLTIRAGRDTAEVFIRRGCLQEVRTARTADEVANLLLPEQLDQDGRSSLEELIRGSELGTVLLLEYLGISSRERSLVMLRKQAIDSLQRITGWRKAEFRFDSSAGLLPGRIEISLPLGVVKRRLQALSEQPG